MNDQAGAQGKAPQKLIDFNEELKALCAKYQYDLRATLVPTPFSLEARMQAFDVSPKASDGVRLKPEMPVGEEAPAIETPAVAQTPVDNTPNP